MTSISFSEQQHTPDITQTSTKLTKLITILPIILFSNIILMGTVKIKLVIQFQTFYNKRYMLTKKYN